MTSAYFAPFVTLPVIIDAPGQYLTRCGETVTIHAVSTRHDYGCVGEYPTEQAEAWHKSGRLFSHGEARNDIVSKASEPESADFDYLKLLIDAGDALARARFHRSVDNHKAAYQAVQEAAQHLHDYQTTYEAENGKRP